ncbi:fibronectin type III domain-containing protein [Runella sp.]|uniref:fibronectin type III domain-containing protein n=1 Tax=Runella sp. TaxID=1960881 RepID=UPI003D0DC219
MKIKLFFAASLLTTVLMSGMIARVTFKPQHTVQSVMDEVVTRLYRKFTPAQLDTLSDSYILTFLSEEEKQTLATRYWTFDVNVPVVVSLMHDQDQKIRPFWLEKSGFRKTAMLVKNDEYTYEVWQKSFPKGKIELGVNGFDKHRPVYFLSVGPQKTGDKPVLSNIFPAHQHFEEMKVGAFTYHDWDELTLTEVPSKLQGQLLLTTVRGRAREAHLVKAFRQTEYPAVNKPDQLLLTWSADPTTTINVQWRTKSNVNTGKVQYWTKSSSDTLVTAASPFTMEDRLLRNDRYIQRFTAHLSHLIPATNYYYRVGSSDGGWSEVSSFKTEAAKPEAFSFIWFGDTHKSADWGNMARQTLERHPEISFYSVIGDLVSTGLDRNEWDEFFQHSGKIFSQKPFMPIPGNHDSQDGLGAAMYQNMFSLPVNGPDKLPTERTYAFNYQNALFVMLDGTFLVDDQTAWIEKQLSQSKAKWKFVMLHFPPYNFEENYANIRKEWGVLFDRYHVDMVMSGHVHYYMRSKPMYAEKPAASPAQGTIYTISISIPSHHKNWPEEPYAAARFQSGPVYQHIRIDKNELTYRCLDPKGNVKDELKIVK